VDERMNKCTENGRNELNEFREGWVDGLVDGLSDGGMNEFKNDLCTPVYVQASVCMDA
jgi:hypothetical protein